MQIECQRILKLVLTSMLIACIVSLPFAADRGTDKSSKDSASDTKDAVQPLRLVDSSEEPLDLSELLKALDEIPHLNDLPKHPIPSQPESPESGSKSVALVANDEPVLIGDDKSKTEPAKITAAQQPANPLRSTHDKLDKFGKPLSTSLHKSPSIATPSTKMSDIPSELKGEDQSKVVKLLDKDESDELQLTIDIPEESIDSKNPSPSKAKDEPRGLQIGGVEKSQALPETAARTRPKMVAIKPITADEQEAPSLSAAAREIDAMQAREEDEKATIAKRPEATSKTFVSKPSTGRITSQGNLPSNPIDARRTQRVENCLAYYMANLETVVERSPWAVMHAMLPYGVEGEIIVSNRRVNSIQWMCYNGTCRTQKLFTPAGKFFRPNVGGGVQGHEGQFLAMLAQSQVGADYPIVVGQNKYSVTDLIRYEMATCVEKSELTFKLIGLSYYVDTNQVWLTGKRNRWNIEKLVQEELAQPIVGAACGGTHRLMGLTFAVRQRQAEGRPIDGQFARADKYVKEFVDYAWRLQNPDGSFSTNWFESRGNEANMERKVQTTGHILEWLAFTLPEQELSSPRFTKSIDFLLSQILDQRQQKWPIGPRGHATRAIALYHQRTTGVAPGNRQTELAEEIRSLKINR